MKSEQKFNAFLESVCKISGHMDMLPILQEGFQAYVASALGSFDYDKTVEHMEALQKIISALKEKFDVFCPYSFEGIGALRYETNHPEIRKPDQLKYTVKHLKYPDKDDPPRVVIDGIGFKAIHKRLKERMPEDVRKYTQKELDEMVNKIRADGIANRVKFFVDNIAPQLMSIGIEPKHLERKGPDANDNYKDIWLLQFKKF